MIRENKLSFVDYTTFPNVIADVARLEISVSMDRFKIKQGLDKESIFNIYNDWFIKCAGLRARLAYFQENDITSNLNIVTYVSNSLTSLKKELVYTLNNSELNTYPKTDYELEFLELVKTYRNSPYNDNRFSNYIIKD